MMASRDPRPGRLLRRKLLPEIGHEFGELAVGQVVPEGGHIAEIARNRVGDAVQDHLDQVVRGGRVQIAVERQRRPAAEQGRTADFVTDRAGALVKAPAGRRGRDDAYAGRAFEVGRQRLQVRFIRGTFLEGRKVGRHGADIFIGQRLEVFHHRRHGARGHAVEARIPRPQIGEQLILTPGDRRVRKRRQRRRFPTFGQAAGEIGVALLRPQCIARRMTGAAMAETFDQIRATIPRRRLRRIGRESRGAME